MKKLLLAGMLGVACGVVSSMGQGVILLDNYQTSGPNVTYGASGIPANGVSGASGTVGAGLVAGWTFGFYYALGDVRSSIGPDPNGGLNIGDPATFGGGLVLATGAGSTAKFYTSVFGLPGEAHSGSVFPFPGTSSAGGDTVTLEMVAYCGSSYATANWRGHSAAFAMTTAANLSVTPPFPGTYMSGFSVFAVPEPSVWALSAAGGFAVSYFRRRNKELAKSFVP